MVEVTESDEDRIDLTALLMAVLVVVGGDIEVPFETLQQIDEDLVLLINSVDEDQSVSLSLASADDVPDELR